jgi:SlyX protein
MSEAFERLETKIAFLEAANNELSDVIYRQQKELAALQQRLTALTSRFDEAQSKPPEWTAAEEKPPHY